MKLVIRFAISIINRFLKGRYKLVLVGNNVRILSRKSVGVIFRKKEGDIYKLCFIRNTRIFLYSTSGIEERTQLEIPAGMARCAESTMKAARREGLEESGLDAQELVPLTFHSSPLQVDWGPEDYVVFLCNNFLEKKQNLDIGECISTSLVWLEESTVKERLALYQSSSAHFYEGLDIDQFTEYALLLYFMLRSTGKL